MTARKRTSLDLNLLTSLDALLRERGVSRAAERVGLSQPAMSAALSRLRREFQDPLLVRNGNTYLLTPLATVLLERSTAALASVDRLFDTRPSVDMSSSTRRFSVVLSEYTLVSVGEPAVREMRHTAPTVSLDFIHMRGELVERAVESLRGADALVVPRGYVFDLPSLDLFVDEWVCVVDTGSLEGGTAVTKSDLRRRPFAVFQADPHSTNTALRSLRAQGLDPQVAVYAESYLAMPYFVTGTDLVALFPASLAQRIPNDFGLSVLPCPIPLAAMKQALWWHPVHNGDPEHRWFRETFHAVASGLDSRKVLAVAGDETDLNDRQPST
ncbi:LysR family transcriptional regulator [Nocardioides sp. DS6]|uniref:LysR family transcriptional regulator n=1 Tax=Nocardioides eburneus TaxID=3231482 RepID=A0ABV3SXM9_9ACTN